MISVHHQQKGLGYGPNRMPPLLAFHNAVVPEKHVRVVEYACGVAKSKPLCFDWLIRSFLESHSKCIVIHNVSHAVERRGRKLCPAPVIASLSDPSAATPSRLVAQCSCTPRDPRSAGIEYTWGHGTCS